MHILLLDPALRNGVPELYENLGIASLAALSRRSGYSSEIILNHVEGWSYRRLGREILKRRPDVLGISLLSFNARPALRMVRRLKAEGLRSRIVLGGHFPTFNDMQILQEWPEIDVIVRGEGDITFAELVRVWDGGGELSGVEGITYREGGAIRSNPARALVSDLDLLPWPARDHTQRIIDAGGTLNMVRSRGCYANCAFCSIASFYRLQGGSAWRQRSVDDVLEEVAWLAKRWPGAEIKFHDDQFIGPGKRGREDAMAFAEALVERGLDIPFYIFARADTIEPELFRLLKRAGLKSVFVGVESGSQRELDAFGKRISVEDNMRALQVLHDLDIRFHMGLIFFDPYTEMEDVEENMAFIRETRPLWSTPGNFLSVENRVIVYKGTPFFDRLATDARIEGDYLDYDYSIRDWRVRVLCRISNLYLNHFLPAFSRLRRLPDHLRLLRASRRHRLSGTATSTAPASGP